VLGAVPSLVGIWHTYSLQGQRPVLVLLSIVLALIVSLTIFKARRSLAKERRYEPIDQPKEIAGWADGCYDALERTFAGTNHAFSAGEVRLTVYSVVFDRQRREPMELEQMIDYVGGSGGPAGRRVSVRTGIIGVCARMSSLVTAERTSDEITAFRQEMVRGWGYTQDEARQLSADRWSFLACPITEAEDGPVIAVAYLDSQTRNLFDASGVQESIIQQCGVLAQIIRRCYS
jgi:hypothetical protein